MDRLRSAGDLARRVGDGFLAHGCVTHGAALAFYALFVLVPVPIFAISGAARLVGDELAREEVLVILRALAGEQMAATLGQALETASELPGGGGAGLFALVSLLFGGTVFFVELQDTLNEIWDVPAARFDWRSFLRSRLVSFVMVAVAGTVLLALTVGGVVARGFGERLRQALPLAAPLLGAGALLASLLVIWGLVCLVFRFVPDEDHTFGDVWLGSLGTALLFVVGNELIGLYLRYSSLATVYGAGGSLVLTLTWIYYSALAFLFGAELTRAVGQRRSSAGPSPAGSRSASGAARRRAAEGRRPRPGG